MKSNQIRTKAPGNLFLLGEHSVVYNRKSLLTSIGRYTETKGREREDKKVKGVKFFISVLVELFSKLVNRILVFYLEVRYLR